MQLTGEQVNEFIAKAVIDSQIGDVVKNTIARVIADLQKTYNNPFDQVIKNNVHAMIEKAIEEQYREVLHDGITKALATHMTDETVSKIIQASIERLGRNF